MYKVSVWNSYGPIGQFLCDEKPTERELRKEIPEEYFIDICRVASDPLSDTANFRQEVEADLEPFDSEDV